MHNSCSSPAPVRQSKTSVHVYVVVRTLRELRSTYNWPLPPAPIVSCPILITRPVYMVNPGDVNTSAVLLPFNQCLTVNSTHLDIISVTWLFLHYHFRWWMLRDIILSFGTPLPEFPVFCVCVDFLHPLTIANSADWPPARENRCILR